MPFRKDERRRPYGQRGKRNGAPSCGFGTTICCTESTPTTNRNPAPLVSRSLAAENVVGPRGCTPRWDSRPVTRCGHGVSNRTSFRRPPYRAPPRRLPPEPYCRFPEAGRAFSHQPASSMKAGGLGASRAHAPAARARRWRLQSVLFPDVVLLKSCSHPWYRSPFPNQDHGEFPVFDQVVRHSREMLPVAGSVLKTERSTATKHAHEQFYSKLATRSQQICSGFRTRFAFFLLRGFSAGADEGWRYSRGAETG